MSHITQLLTVFGENVYMIVILCAEILIGVVLFSTALTRSIKKNKKPAVIRGVESEFIDAMNSRNDEVCLVVRTSDLMPVYASGNFEKMFGVSLDDIRGDMALLNSNFQTESASFDIWKKYRAWDGRSEWNDEFQLKSGEWVHMHMSRRDGRSCDMFSFTYITELHRALEDYENRLSQADEESQSKTTFLSRMSHEIRTPMNGIIGMLSLAEGKLDADHPAMQYLSKIDELSDHLLALINDILDMSRIEAGKVELEEKPFSLRKMGDKLYDMFAKNLEQRNINYTVEFEDMTIDYVMGDELRISQVIINFLSNAVKFTEKGEIRVTFRQMVITEGTADVMIRVRDTGIGMAPEFVNRIFRPFEQESIDTQKKYGGTGLGMAITDQIVKLMGGEIVVESMLGKGSDFMVFLHLPLAEKPEEAAGASDSAEDETQYDTAFEGKSILVAEDNELNAVIATEVLHNMGAKVDRAKDGQDAVDHFNGHDPGYYDFILMDVQMPVMDGRTAARTIRGLARADAKDIPIFALSADAFVEDERLSRESGMNGHYAKPIDFTELQRSIGAFLQGRERM